MARFTVSEDEQLIELVGGHPILWNMADKEFKNAVKKDLVWKEIGLFTNKTASECKTRWRSIKDHRKRQKKQDAKVGTGSAATKRKASYWNRLNFLDTVEDERSTFSNVDIEETQNKEDNENVDFDATPDELDLVQPPVNTTNNKNGNDETSTTGTNKYKKKVRKDNKELTELLKSRDEQRAENRKRIYEALSQDEDNEIDLFFKAMAATVKKFSDENQVETKMQVFNIINQMEFREKRYRNVERLSTFDYPHDTSNNTMSPASYGSMATPGPSPAQSPAPMVAASNDHIQTFGSMTAPGPSHVPSTGSSILQLFQSNNFPM